ncbi:hypothetical protein SAMN05421678_101176 [Actinopolymorpha cephalotaxi]|uniref:Uncharacterized protein n=1 Tax=Actinopolymorpha cephalotaxi TaxID=504797 RepID=A0A1I2KCP8_9ACTN|nr:hypothetical protein SAMN05421678_101176 [Actinopolymorpha cephalotaxi]
MSGWKARAAALAALAAAGTLVAPCVAQARPVPGHPPAERTVRSTPSAVAGVGELILDEPNTVGHPVWFAIAATGTDGSPRGRLWFRHLLPNGTVAADGVQGHRRRFPGDPSLPGCRRRLHRPRRFLNRTACKHPHLKDVRPAVKGTLTAGRTTGSAGRRVQSRMFSCSRGTSASSRWVYSCRGLKMTSSVGPCSTTWPWLITSTRSLT